MVRLFKQIGKNMQKNIYILDEFVRGNKLEYPNLSFGEFSNLEISIFD